MNSLEQVLTGIEELRLRPLNLSRESRRKILHHNTIRACEEAENILDEVSFIVSELFPVLHVLAEVNLLRSPKDRHVLLVFGPEVIMFDRENHKTVRIVLEKCFRKERNRNRLGRAYNNRRRESE